MRPNQAGRWIFLSGFILVLVLLSLITPKPTLAAVRCETQYGGTEVCVTTGQLQVNKEIFDPQSKQYVDNLGINDYKFSPGELLSFRISIKNVGDATLSKVTVTDTPQAGFLDLVTGALNFDLIDVKPGETRQQELKLRVVDASQLPQNNIICIINAAEASADSNKDRDTAQFCLERKVLGVQPKELPKTGFGTGLLTLFGSVLGLTVGFKFTRFGNKVYSYANNVYTAYFIAENRSNQKVKGVKN